MPQRKKINGKEKPTDKEKVYAKEYVKTLSKIKAFKKAYPTEKSTLQTQYSNSQAVHKRPIVQEELSKIFARHNLTDQTVTEIHHRNLIQEDNLNVSQKAVHDYYEVKGYLADKKDSTHTKVAFIVHGDVNVDSTNDNKAE